MPDVTAAAFPLVLSMPAHLDVAVNAVFPMQVVDGAEDAQQNERDRGLVQRAVMHLAGRAGQAGQVRRCGGTRKRLVGCRGHARIRSAEMLECRDAGEVGGLRQDWGVEELVGQTA